MTEPFWITRLRPHAGQLARVAQEGGEPRQLADAILSFFMPAHDKGLLRELVANDDAQAQIVAAFPELAPFPTWLAEFIDETRIILGLIAAPDDDEA
jgi:hypothetical protein